MDEFVATILKVAADIGYVVGVPLAEHHYKVHLWLYR